MNPSWKYAPLWGLLLAVFPLFFFAGPGYHATRSFAAFWDLGHIFFFALFSVWITTVAPPRMMERPWRLLAMVSLLVLFMGGAVEALQSSTSGRSPDTGDLLRNQLGCVAAFAWLLRARFQERGRVRLLQAAVTALLLWAFWPLTRAVIDEALALRSFPVLSDFETPFERYRWVSLDQTRLERTIVRQGAHSMRVRLSTNKYSGVSLFYFPGDWRGYQALHLSVYNPGAAPLEFNCRINDQEHKQHGAVYADRYNERFALSHGWNDLVIPLDKVRNAPKGRLMDMAHIQGVILFVVELPSPGFIYLDDIYLTR